MDKKGAVFSENNTVIPVESFTDKELEYLKLIAEIIVELTFKQAHEKGNSLSEIQQ